jgi:nucleotide-binding universal stress UspA family protein
MQNVLLAYDGSESATRALRHLLQMPAPQRPRQIHVLNVQVSPLFHGQILTHDDVRRMHEAQLARGREVLRPAEEELLTAGVDFRSHVVLGEAEHQIIEMARELACDHIVMGTRGLGTIRTLLLGSVALKTVHLAPVPITLVK